MKSLIILPFLFLTSCRDHQLSTPPKQDEPQAVEIRDILPLKISIQGLGQLSPVATRISADISGIEVEILAESKPVHLSKFSLDEERLRSALYSLQPDSFQQKNVSGEITEGLRYTVEAPLGTITIYLDSTSPETLLPKSAAPFNPLLALIDGWNKKAAEEWKRAFIDNATRERNIVEPLVDFLEKGMKRKEILKNFPEPDIATRTLLIYGNWEPALIKNAGRKGIQAINISLEDDIVTGWSITSSG